MPDALATLLFPFDRGLLDAPQPGERAIVLGATAGFRLPADFSANFQLVQGFRPDYVALEKAGFEVTAEPAGDNFDMALVLLGRHRRENEARMAEALARVRAGGIILAAGTKNDGASSMAKRIGEIFPLENRLSKNHGVVFWLRRPQEIDTAAMDALAVTDRRTEEGFETTPGGFSEGEVDPGSRLLAEHLPENISGRIADFAAGWGYLSLRIAQRHPGAEIDLYEAHYTSLEAARRNLTHYVPEANCRFFWHDLLSEPVSEHYDAIVMNPPFHQGRATEPDLGRAMIASASRALKPGGRLFLVANRSLPYEAALSASFSRHGEICRDDTYKILWGVR